MLLISVTLISFNFNIMDQQIINLYDEYTHKPLSRNEFLRRLAMLAGGTAAAMTLLPTAGSKLCPCRCYQPGRSFYGKNYISRHQW